MLVRLDSAILARMAREESLPPILNGLARTRPGRTGEDEGFASEAPVRPAGSRLARDRARAGPHPGRRRVRPRLRRLRGAAARVQGDRLRLAPRGRAAQRPDEVDGASAARHDGVRPPDGRGGRRVHTRPAASQQGCGAAATDRRRVRADRAAAQRGRNRRAEPGASRGACACVQRSHPELPDGVSATRRRTATRTRICTRPPTRRYSP